MKEQPEALRLSYLLDGSSNGPLDARHKAAAELRRLHAENEALKTVVNAARNLVFESEEYEFDDGLGRGAPQSYWDELDSALEEIT